MLEFKRPGAADPDLQDAVGAEPLGCSVIGQRVADNIRPVVQHPRLGKPPLGVQGFRQFWQQCRQSARALRFF